MSTKSDPWGFDTAAELMCKLHEPLDVIIGVNVAIGFLAQQGKGRRSANQVNRLVGQLRQQF